MGEFVKHGFPQSLWRSLLVFATLLAASVPATAQPKYPERPIRLIVPFAAGGATDVVARFLAQGLQERLGQTAVVENRPGAGSNLGANAVARSEPDGHTLLVASSGIIASPALYKNLPYDIFKDLVPIAELAGGPNVIVANPNAGIASLGEMIAQAKADPEKLNYASPGVGTTPQLAMELLKLRAGIKVTHVAYAGGSGAMQAIVAGTVPLGVMALGNLGAQVKEGIYRGLAVTGTQRWRDLPDIPTVQELGYPNFDSETIFILMAPGGTPSAIVDLLAREAATILDRPQVRERIEQAGMAVLGRGPEALKARIIREVPEYKDIVAKAGIQVN
jgi:tripartite-type tricarboxylate transporter receptor subunit TctC